MATKRKNDSTPQVSEAAGTLKPVRTRARAPRKQNGTLAGDTNGGSAHAITRLAGAVGPSVRVEGCPDHDEVARLAYSYWEARGRQGGSPEEDWHRAEQALMTRQTMAAHG